MNGKGSTPRNIGPKFRANYDAIFRAKKTKSQPKISLQKPKSLTAMKPSGPFRGKTSHSHHA